MQHVAVPSTTPWQNLARLAQRSPRSDINSANLAAGFTAGLWYVFAGISVHLDVAARLRLSPEAASSWLFIICFTAAVSGILLTLRYRQPLSIGATIPGWVLLATVGSHYSVQEVAGAVLAAGAIVVLLGPLGIGERLMHWLPLPIVMGMFAGSILGYATGIFEHFGAQPATVGAALLGYLLTRALGQAWLPPTAGAAAAGLAVAALGGQVHPQSVDWSPPSLVLVAPVFSPGALLALTLPLVVLVAVLGNVQGLGFLVSQGYHPPINLVNVVVGLNSVVNALFGGGPSAVARNAIAMMASKDGGPWGQRYVANLVASAFLLLLALGAASVSSLAGVLPMSLIATLAGLAILGALMDALHKAVQTELPVGAFFALAIAASPLTLLGIGSAFWALIGGLLVSLVLERQPLVQAWKHAARA